MSLAVLSAVADFFQNITLLSGIWLGSMFLGGLSTLVMVGLVLFRVRDLRREIKRQARLKQLRRRILQFLEVSSDLAGIEEAFKDEDQGLVQEIVMLLLGSVRGDSRELLISLLWAVGVRDTALRHLAGGSVLDRLNAVEVLALYSDDEVIGALHRALDDREPQVRLTAAQALAELDPDLRVRDLVDKLDIGGATRSRMLREIFCRVGGRRPQDLVDLLEGDYNETVMTLALYAIGRAQDYSTVPVVAKQMESPSVNVRAEAMRALTSIGHPAAKAAVLKALDSDPAWPVRAQAAVCAGRIGFSDAVWSLRTLLEDEEWWARFRAAEALVKLGPNGIGVLEETSRGQGRSAQIAELVLSERGAA